MAYGDIPPAYWQRYPWPSFQAWNGGYRTETQDIVCPHCGEVARTIYVSVPDVGSGSTGFTGAPGDGGTWNQAG